MCMDMIIIPRLPAASPSQVVLPRESERNLAGRVAAWNQNQNQDQPSAHEDRVGKGAMRAQASPNANRTLHAVIARPHRVRVAPRSCYDSWATGFACLAMRQWH